MTSPFANGQTTSSYSYPGEYIKGGGHTSVRKITLASTFTDFFTATVMPDARTLKRLQQDQAENEAPLNAPRAPTPPKAAGDRKASLMGRRRSGIQKAPLGPRPQDATSRRIMSNTSSSIPPPGTNQYIPNTISEPFLGLSARKDSMNLPRPTPPRASLALPQEISSSRHTPSVDFDAFQDNAATIALPLASDFDRVSTSRKSLNVDRLASGLATVPANIVPPKRTTTLNPLSQSQQASHERQRSQALRAAQLSTAAAMASANNSAGPLSLRNRRQSHFPPSSAASAANIEARQPRKSIGPGATLLNDAQARPLRDSSQASIDGGVLLNRQPSATRSKAAAAVAASSTSSSSSAMAADRLDSSNKPASQESTSQQVTASSINAPGRSRAESSTNTKRKPSAHVPESSDTMSFVKPPLPRAQTPSSSSANTAHRKRAGTPGLASGLGARTISPTDARRMKRTSTHPPPIPTRSPSPEANPVFRSGRTPPPAGKHKSVSPASVRATPEGIIKLDSGRSVSSRSSYSSCRPMSSSLAHRGPTNFSSLNSRGMHSSSGPGEGSVVPPVPKIPLAYESPSEGSEKPFSLDVAVPPIPKEFTPRSSVTLESGGAHRESETTRAAPVREIRQARRLTLGTRPDATKAPQHAHKQSQQSVRLPPFTLQPLSNPTEARLAQMSKKSPLQAPGTPPPQRQTSRTPTTPMTASKATFPSRDLHFTPDMSTFPKIRSNTSYANSRAASANMGSSRGGSPDSAAQGATASRQSRSPNSSSVRSRSRSKSKQRSKVARSRSRDPTTSNALNSAKLPSTTAAAPATSESVGTGLMGRLSRATSKSARNSQALVAGSETDKAAASTSNVRRKLSMGWRRSSSKASNNLGDAESESGPMAVTSDMAPPRLPPSANASLRPSPRLSLSSDGSKIPSLGAGIADAAAAGSVSSLTTSVKSTRSGNAAQEPTPNSMRPTSNFLTPMQRILGPRSSSGATKNAAPSQGFDKSDFAADEEMKKLAAKKKEFEAAAREVDDLKKRAFPRDAVTPSRALKHLPLTLFERGEIIDYHAIYFAGTKNASKISGDLSEKSNNFGFDDERGDYNIVLGDHLAYQYEVVDLLGKGSFGQVVRCIDHQTGKLVAIKIIRNKKRFHQQALIEVNILQKLKEWDPQAKHSMVNFTKSFYFRGHLCISTELLGINLYEFIKAHDFRGFSLKLIRRFAQQMLNSLCMLQSRSVIHCDLKPENILLAHPLHSEIKVIDFGSSCFENEKVYTYIQSRFYRSPEVILGMSYGMPIDMWSFGCILAELYTGYPIFPGENEQEQLACIMEIFGPPEKHVIEQSSRKKLFFDSLGKPRVTVSSKGKRRRPSSKTLQQALKCDDEGFVDFIARCLRWDAARRMKPDEAMGHQFITGEKKAAARPRNAAAPSSRGTSPAKRGVATQAPPLSRPLPETPATVLRNGVLTTNHEAANASPLKSAAVQPAVNRRHSALINPQTAAGMKRASNGNAIGSPLPRPGAGRSASGKPDLASAAAIASLRPR